ncbi:hypothetical protein EV1_041414 [Malus domestica]
METQGLQNYKEFVKPGPMSLLQSIQGFSKFVDMMRIIGITETGGLLHIDIFLKVSMQKSITDIQLVEKPIMLNCKR